MELQQLRYFIEVAHSQHMTRSAERLNISQPSLSQSIRRLENELGVSLFEARGRNIVLTESGTYLLHAVEPIIRRLDSIPEQIREFNSNGSATIHLHVTAASLVVSEAIIEYRRKNGRINFQFLLNDDDSICDMTISSSLAPAHDKAGDVFTCNEKIYIAVPADSGYVNFSRLDQFREADFIALITQKQFRRICDRLCASVGFSPNIAFESDSPETVRNMIAANMGVGFWPAFSWGELKHGNVRMIEINDPVCSRSIMIKKRRTGSSTVDDFYNFLTDYMLERMYRSYGIG